MLRQTHGSQQYWLDYLQLFIETHFFSTAQLSFSVRCLHNESPSLFASGWDGLKHNQDRLRPSLESHHILTHLLLLLYFYILLMTTCWPPAKLQLPQTLRDQFRHKEFYKIIQVIVIVSSFFTQFPLSFGSFLFCLMWQNIPSSLTFVMCLTNLSYQVEYM